MKYLDVQQRLAPRGCVLDSEPLREYPVLHRSGMHHHIILPLLNGVASLRGFTVGKTH